MAAEISTSTAELTKRAPMTFVTGCWAASDVPKLPCRIPVSQVQYCCNTGVSRCSVLRSAARLAGVLLRPRIARAGITQRLGRGEDEDGNQEQDEDRE